MKAPDGLIFIYKPKGLSIEVEERELILCKNCKHMDDDFGCSKVLCRQDVEFCGLGERKEE